ncbi:MAG: DUF3352 domain-containing protein [Chlorobi bacterium]|nr:DUF3352 domain-containing protein [Chlorobiota bacterium]
MKRLLTIVLLLLLAGGALFWFLRKPSPAAPLLAYVPGDAVFVWETERLTDTWEEVHKTNIWQHLIRTPGFEDWQETDSLLTRMLLENAFLGSLFKNRPTLMSVHLRPREADFSLLYAVSLKSARSVKKLTDALADLGAGPYRVVRKTRNGHHYYVLLGLDDPFYFAFKDRTVLGSFDLSLLFRALALRPEDAFLNAPARLVEEELPEGLVKWWTNYRTLPDFAAIYFTDARAYLRPLARNLLLSGISLDHDEDLVRGEGWTLPSARPSYFTALLDVKPAKPAAWQILSRRTAVYISQTFKSFNLFHQSLLDAWGQSDPQAKKAYVDNLKKWEKFFKIDIQADFFDWIGKEIALVKLRTYRPQKPETVLLLLHTRDRERAREGLNRIAEQIRKKTPFKFKSYRYKNFEINYLHQKGFFKTFLGDLFKGIDRPYYTLIEDYVVFANSEDELHLFIDDYLTGNILSKDDDFNAYREGWYAKSHLLLYVHMPKTYALLRQWLTGEGLKELEEKKDFILSMHRISLQLSGENDKFATRLLVDHNPEARALEETEALAYEIDEAVHNKYYESLAFKIVLPDTLAVKDGPYRLTYPDGRLQAEGPVKKGKPHGLWRTYYPSGRVESAVMYQRGRVYGDAIFYYDSRPAVTLASMTFEDDKLEGIYREYYRNGTLKAEIPYKDGLPHGEAKYYYPDGTLKAKGKFKKGKKRGKWIFYKRNGEPAKKVKYGGLF